MDGEAGAVVAPCSGMAGFRQLRRVDTMMTAMQRDNKTICKYYGSCSTRERCLGSGPEF
jgi:hypothetical protein